MEIGTPTNEPPRRGMQGGIVSNALVELIGGSGWMAPAFSFGDGPLIAARLLCWGIDHGLQHLLQIIVSHNGLKVMLTLDAESRVN